MTPHHTSSWPMLQFAVEMGLHRIDGSGGDADLRRVEEYIEAYRAWAPDRDRTIARHLLETPNVYRVIIPAGPGALDLAARSSWYFDQVIVEDPLAFLLDSGSLWRFKSPPQFETSLSTEWVRSERVAIVLDSLRRLWDLHELLASRSILLTMLPSGNLLPWQREPATSPNPMQEQLAHQIADVLAVVEHDEGRAKLLATRAGLPVQYLPKFELSAVFWSDVVGQAIRGRFLLSELVRRAAAEFPHNPELAELATRLEESMPTPRVGSPYDDLAARVFVDPSFRPWLRSGSDLRLLDTVPPGDSSRWQFCRAELNGVYKLNVHRNEPVGPGQLVTATFTPHDLPRVDWPIGSPDVLPEFKPLLEDLLRTYLQGLGSTGAHALDSGMGILTRDRTERRLVRTILQRKALDEDPSLAVADSFHVAAPMLDGLTPKQLFELRAELPLAFVEFRAKLASICRSSRSIEEAQLAADLELVPLAQQLEGDLDSLKARARPSRDKADPGTVLDSVGTSFVDTGPLPDGSNPSASTVERKLRSRAPLFLWEARTLAGKRNV